MATAGKRGVDSQVKTFNTFSHGITVTTFCQALFTFGAIFSVLHVLSSGFINKCEMRVSFLIRKMHLVCHTEKGTLGTHSNRRLFDIILVLLFLFPELCPPEGSKKFYM